MYCPGRLEPPDDTGSNLGQCMVECVFQGRSSSTAPSKRCRARALEQEAASTTMAVGKSSISPSGWYISRFEPI
ncbi:hypothetical protein QYE76_025197 [Lolium multiflorum]|uniref:Uncharacterized protein n=1 Tax=Lolium multiflorum TaxID=4521 RepID=A0AAD8RDX1_LOLMU|nr:hypothetical protein QYE76_025197 [Lolium multiflorum]